MAVPGTENRAVEGKSGYGRISQPTYPTVCARNEQRKGGHRRASHRGTVKIQYHPHLVTREIGLTREQPRAAAEVIGRVGTAGPVTATSHSKPRERGGGTAVADTAASYHPAPRPFSNMIPRGRMVYQYTTAYAGSDQRGSGHCFARHRGKTSPPTHFDRKPETYPRTS